MDAGSAGKPPPAMPLVSVRAGVDGPAASAASATQAVTRARKAARAGTRERRGDDHGNLNDHDDDRSGADAGSGDSTAHTRVSPKVPAQDGELPLLAGLLSLAGEPAAAPSRSGGRAIRSAIGRAYDREDPTQPSIVRTA